VELAILIAHMPAAANRNAQNEVHRSSFLADFIHGDMAELDGAVKGRFRLLLDCFHTLPISQR